MSALAEVLRDWKSVRGDTMELLESLNDKKLLFKPEGDHWQTLSYQFACIGRTQLVYAWALSKGRMETSDFSNKGLPVITDITTQALIGELLTWADDEWLKALSAGFESVKVANEGVSVTAFAARLAGHERLHQGQVVSYFTLARYKFPKQFKAKWAL